MPMPGGAMPGGKPGGGILLGVKPENKNSNFRTARSRSKLLNIIFDIMLNIYLVGTFCLILIDSLCLLGNLNFFIKFD